MRTETTKGRTMRENAKNEIVVSIGPNKMALITIQDDEIKNARKLDDSDDEICEMARAYSDSIATEILAQTQSSIDEFCGRYGARLIHRLADYPVAGS